MRFRINIYAVFATFAGLVALGSGLVLVREARSLARFFGSPSRQNVLGESARAPAQQRLLEALPAPVFVGGEIPAPKPVDIAQAPKEPAAPATDQVKAAAYMAPERSETALIEARGNGVQLRAEPHARAAIVAIARPRYRYHVADFSERWFKVIVPGKTGDIAGWVRSDQVRIVTSDMR